MSLVREISLLKKACKITNKKRKMQAFSPIYVGQEMLKEPCLTHMNFVFFYPLNHKAHKRENQE